MRIKEGGTPLGIQWSYIHWGNIKTIYLFFITAFLCGKCVFKTENANPVVIDKDVQRIVESEIIDTFQDNQYRNEWHYESQLHLKYYANDSLQTFNLEDKYKPFWSSWKEERDTIDVCGLFNIGEGSVFGFDMTIADKIPTVYFLIHGGMMKQLAHTKNSVLEYSLKVPTESSKVTLSSIPDKRFPKTIYGIAEFESKSFFQASKFENGHELPDARDNVKCSMTIYFKANDCDSCFEYISYYKRNYQK